MPNALVTVVLPTTRTDGSAFDANSYGGSHIFRSDDGGVTFTQVATVLAPSLTFTDGNIASGDHQYAASVFDTQQPPVESGRSAPASVSVAAVLAAPSTPSVTVSLV